MSMKTQGGAGGVIVLGKDGQIGCHHTTDRMAWAAMNCMGKIQYGIEGGEEIVEKI